MRQHTSERPPDYIPSREEPHTRKTQVPFGWGDVAFLGGGLVGTGMMLLTAFGETQTWHVPVLAVAFGVCLTGIIKVRPWR